MTRQRITALALLVMCSSCADALHVGAGGLACSARILARLPAAPSIAEALDAAACGLELYGELLDGPARQPELGEAVGELERTRRALTQDPTDDRAKAVAAALAGCDSSAR